MRSSARWRPGRRAVVKGSSCGCRPWRPTGDPEPSGATSKGSRWDVRLRTPEGRVYTRTFGSRREAETFEARERADRSRGGWIDPRRAETEFGEWAAQWLASNPAKRPSVRAREEGIARVHLLPTFGHRALGSITPVEVQGRVLGWSERPAPRSVGRQYGVLRAILRAAVEADFIVRSPCRGIKLPAVEPLDRHVVTADELGRLAPEIGEDLAPMVQLGAVFGLRWGECAGLRVGRIDFLRGR